MSKSMFESGSVMVNIIHPNYFAFYCTVYVCRWVAQMVSLGPCMHPGLDASNAVTRWLGRCALSRLITPYQKLKRCTHLDTNTGEQGPFFSESLEAYTCKHANTKTC